MRLIKVIGLLALLLAAALIIVPFPARADSPTPTSISAVYNVVTGQLDVEVMWEFDICPDSKKGVGIAIFIDGSNPVSPSTGSLDGVDTNTMHVVTVPCTSSSGTFSDTHSLPPAATPAIVCAVVYDPHVDDVGEDSGHNDIPAGSDRNTDNSYEKKIGSKPEDSYSAEACVAMFLVVPETPIGSILLIGSMFGGLLVFGLFRWHRD